LNLAPVGISTYSRLDHLQATVQGLASDPLSDQTDIFVFSDGPRTGDEENVTLVRDFLRELNGFKSVTVIERETNNRVFNNRDGIRTLLEQYGRIIFMEEDILIAPGFLCFMNLALKTYEHNNNVFSISGYRPPIKIPSEYTSDVFLLPRFCGWGFGTWKDRWDRIETRISRSEYLRLILNPSMIRRFNRGGLDMLFMLHADVFGQIDALDVKIFYQQFKMNMGTIYPVRHLAANRGHDGTGIHCVESSRFDVDLDSSGDYDFHLPQNVDMNEQIIESNKAFRRPGKSELIKMPLRMIRDILSPAGSMYRR